METRDEEIKIAIVVDRPRISAAAEGKIIWGWDYSFLTEKLRKVGIAESQVIFAELRNETECAEKLAKLPNLTVIVPLGEKPLRFFTGKKSISKWHLSPLDALPQFKTRKVIPTWHPDDVKKDFALGLYVEMAFKRAREEMATREFARKPKRFLLNPGLPETYDVLSQLEKLTADDWLSIDIETGRGLINTVGFAWSPNDAIAIQTLPSRLVPESFHELWTRIARVCEGPSKKLMQNGIYEILYFARYGISVPNFKHDTMAAQKFLWPEFEKGLDNVGRFYTREPYWKDTGRIESEEGKRKDWGDIKDWSKHLEYNCLDTTGTFEGAMAQRQDLEARNQLEMFDNYLMRLMPVMNEMCLRGLPVNLESQKNLIAEYEAEISTLAAGLSQPIEKKKKQVSAVTRTQKINLLEGKGYRIPTKKNKETGKVGKSVDELSLKMVLQKHPDDTDIPKLLKIAEYEKALSSYFRVSLDPFDKRARFMLDICATETGRWAGNTDAWSRGFNPQTLPKYAKKMIDWSGTDRIFVQVDLRQAETRFVAYDACDTNLIACIEDPTRDIHSEVASEIFECSVEQVIAEKKAGDDGKRQLGKKSGHGANYGVAANTFVNSCLKELDLVITKQFGQKALDAYHVRFPGIRPWHASIRDELWRTRKLENPLGRVRYFYGRMDDDTFREAYAWKPQSTIPDITNYLILGLDKMRKAGAFDFWFHLQCHDSVTLSCVPAELDKIAQFCLDVSKWHPKIMLRAGLLVIPTEVEWGTCLGKLKKYDTVEGKHG